MIESFILTAAAVLIAVLVEKFIIRKRCGDYYLASECPVIKQVRENIDKKSKSIWITISEYAIYAIYGLCVIQILPMLVFYIIFGFILFMDLSLLILRPLTELAYRKAGMWDGKEE